MQKILRINTQARKLLLRQRRKQTLHEQKEKKEDWQRWKARYDAEQYKNVKAERKSRRQDWVAGPLAPDRNTGLSQDMVGGSGLEETRRMTKPLFARSARERPHYGNEQNIIIGDRVCVITGREKGKIGTVIDIDVKDGRLTVMGINMADIVIPETSPPEMRTRKLNSMELPLDLDDVRLVSKRTDPKTGRETDVIARYIEGGAPYFDREHGSNLPRHTRYFAGTNEVIEWPEEEIEDYERFEVDTPRKYVAEVTYIPTVIPNPLPPGALGDVFSKYDRLRPYHEHDYVARKIIEDARSEWYQNRRMGTPMQQHLQRSAAERWRLELEQIQATGSVSPEDIDALQERVSKMHAANGIKTGE